MSSTDPSSIPHQRHLRIETHAGLLECELSCPAGPLRLADLARTLRPLCDAHTALVQSAAAAAGRPAQCRAACGACCRQLVTLSPAEAWMIDEFIAAQSDVRRHVIDARLAQIERRLAEASLLERLLGLEDPSLSDEAHYELAQAYFALGQPCPFLEAESCGIYPERPALCREYLVRSAAACCADPFRHAVEPLAVATPVSEALTALCAQCLRSELQPLPLVLARRWAARHRADQERRWDGRVLLDRFLLHLEVAIVARAS